MKQNKRQRERRQKTQFKLKKRKEVSEEWTHALFFSLFKIGSFAPGTRVPGLGCAVWCVPFGSCFIPFHYNRTEHNTLHKPTLNPHHQGIINHRLWEERKNEVNRREKVREKKWRTLFSSFHFSFFQFNSLCEECFVSFSFIQQNKACVILTFVCSWMKRKEQKHQSHNRDSQGCVVWFSSFYSCFHYNDKEVKREWKHEWKKQNHTTH